MECLVPDFRGDEDCVATIVNSNLDVFAHNIETVEQLTPFVRDMRAQYRYDHYCLVLGLYIYYSLVLYFTSNYLCHTDSQWPC